MQPGSQTFDEHQSSVFGLDPSRHACIIGAPGTGKTRVLIEMVRRLLEEEHWQPSDVLVIAANRSLGSHLRSELERALAGPISGTLVRTAQSLGYSLVAQHRADKALPGLSLLTGAQMDELLQRELATLAPGQFQSAGLPTDLIGSPEFRTQLRTLWNTLDDFGIDQNSLASALTSTEETDVEPHLKERWLAAADMIAATHRRANDENPHHYTANALMREAVNILHRDSDGLVLPKLVLIDDAADLSEGGLGLLAGLAARGSALWFFGDPDTATGAFHGEGPRVLSDPEGALVRRGAPMGNRDEPFQRVVLDRVHRHGADVRQVVSRVTERIGTAALGQQRRTEVAHDGRQQHLPSGHAGVQFVRVGSASEQVGVIAHRLRRLHLGDGDTPGIPWSQLAVICRSGGEAEQLIHALAHLQVPTTQASGGVILKDHQLVRDFIFLLQHVFGWQPLTGSRVREMLSSPVIGLDVIAIRRLAAAMSLQERQAAKDEAREPRDAADLFAASFDDPRVTVDTIEGRALSKLGNMLKRGQALITSATPREVLWSLWSESGLANKLQRQALTMRGRHAEEAHASLDAVMALFFALQRHEEQGSSIPTQEMLEDLLTSAVPQDNLAARSARDAVTVSTPQGVLGREFTAVCIAGPQEGVWPNLRPRGAVLQTIALERFLRGDSPEAPSRKDTLHDELRLFAVACSRATSALLVVSIDDDETFASPFVAFGSGFTVSELPSARHTLRGAVAHYRRRLTADPNDEVAANTLARLAEHGVPGAHPDEWYGVRPASTSAPLIDLTGDPDATVRVSPSQLETVEQCPLNWVISHLGGGTSNTSANLGTLVHHALETVGMPDPEQMSEVVDREWQHLEFDAQWESTRLRATAEAMIHGLAGYLRTREAIGIEVAATEASLTVRLGRTVVSGQADRIELISTDDGEQTPIVIDLKTGSTTPKVSEIHEHAQLLAYQLGLLEGTFHDRETDEEYAFGQSGGASLLYVHPKAQKKGESFRVYRQDVPDSEAIRVFKTRVQAAGQLMAGASFEARVEHHCSDQYVAAACKAHIIPPVSFA